MEGFVGGGGEGRRVDLLDKAFIIINSFYMGIAQFSDYCVYQSMSYNHTVNHCQTAITNRQKHG